MFKYNISIIIDMTKEGLRILKTLGEESRYRIVKAILDGEKCACELPGLIKRTQSNTSMHLAKLLESGILKSRRDGKKILYSIKDMRVCDIFKALRHSKKIILKPRSCAKGCK